MAKNKILPLAAGVAVIAVFGAGWLILRSIDAAEDAVTNITVDTLAGEVTKIDYTLPSDDDISLVYKNSEWQWAEDADFPLRQTYPETMIQMAQSPAATALVTETPESLAEYGLDEPAQSITLTNSGGESKTYLLGSENTHTGEYYLKEADSDAVYTVASSFASAFANPLYGMIITETWPITSASLISEVTLEKADGSVLSVRAEETEVTASSEAASITEAESVSESAASSEAETETVTTYSVSNSKEGEYVTPDNSGAYSAYTWISSLATMSFSACVDYKADDAELASLGLDAAHAATLTVKYKDGDEEKAFALLIGNGSGDGVYFVKQPNSTAVNTMEGDALTTFLGTTYDSLI